MGETFNITSSIAPPKGCICPPTSERTCQRSDCGRRDVGAPIPALHGRIAGDVLTAVGHAIPVGEFSIREIKERVQAPPKQISNAIGYLTRKGSLEHLGYGRYRRSTLQRGGQDG